MSLKTAHDLDEKWRSNDIVLEENVDFSALMLSDRVLNGLKKAGFKKPSPIQLQAIPLGRFGLDLVVQAKSGTGKTCVFTVIALENLLDVSTTQVVILTPTREIATQICDVVKSIGCCFKSLKCNAFIGGLSVSDDQKKANGCQIAVGTPGRVRQLIGLSILRIESVRLFIIDEADKMLDEVFSGDLNWIFSSLPENKQVLAVSATFSKKLANIITTYMRNPLFVRLNIDEIALLGIFQYYCITKFHPVININYKIKYDILWKIVNTVKFSQCLIFCNMITRVESLCNDLNAAGFPTASMSSAQDQEERLEAIEKLKTFQSRILVTSDLVARGIDAENVDLVINFDLPYDVETYLHRIGRAGRYGSRGISIALIPENEMCYLLKFCEKTKLRLYSLPDPIPSNLSDLEPDDSQLLPQVPNKVGVDVHSKENSKNKNWKNSLPNKFVNYPSSIETSEQNEVLNLIPGVTESKTDNSFKEEQFNNNSKNISVCEISHVSNNNVMLSKIDCEEELISIPSESILDHNYCKQYAEKTDKCSLNNNQTNDLNTSQENLSFKNYLSSPRELETIFDNSAEFDLSSEHKNGNQPQLESINLECKPTYESIVSTELPSEDAVSTNSSQIIQFVNTKSDAKHKSNICVSKNGILGKETSDNADRANVEVENEEIGNDNRAEIHVENDDTSRAEIQVEHGDPSRAEIQVQNDDPSRTKIQVEKKEIDDACKADILVLNDVKKLSDLGSIEVLSLNENMPNAKQLLQPTSESSIVNDNTETFVHSIMGYYSHINEHGASSAKYQSFEKNDDYKSLVHSIFPVSDHKNISYKELIGDLNNFVICPSDGITSSLGTGKVESQSGAEMTEVIENIFEMRKTFYSKLCGTLVNIEKTEKDSNNYDSCVEEKLVIDIVEQDAAMSDAEAEIMPRETSEDFILCDEVSEKSNISEINSSCKTSELSHNASDNEERSFPLKSNTVTSRLKISQSSSSTETTTENLRAANSEFQTGINAAFYKDNALPNSLRQSSVNAESEYSEGVLSSAENNHYSLLSSVHKEDPLGNDVHDFKLNSSEKSTDDDKKLLCSMPGSGSRKKHKNVKKKKKPTVPREKTHLRNDDEITRHKIKTSKASNQLNDGHYPAMKWIPVNEKKVHSFSERSNIVKPSTEDPKTSKGAMKDSKDSHINRPTQMFPYDLHYRSNPVCSSYYQYPFHTLSSGRLAKNDFHTNCPCPSSQFSCSRCNCFRTKSSCCSNITCCNRHCGNVCSPAYCKRFLPCHNVMNSNSSCDMQTKSHDFYIYYTSYLQNMLRFPH